MVSHRAKADLLLSDYEHGAHKRELKQMYAELPYSLPEAENLEKFLRQDYNLSESFQSHDQDLISCKKVYEDLWANLNQSP